MTTQANLESVTVLNYVIERQNGGKNTNVGQIAKKFSITPEQVAEHLVGFEGYTVQFSDELIGSKTTVTIYAADGADAEVEETVAQETAEEPVTTEEAVVADAPKPSRAGKPRSEVYENYTTKEFADEAHPEGYISVAEMDKRFKTAGVPISRMVKAFGGDRLAHTPLTDYWTPFTIGGGTKRYLSLRAAEDIETFKDAEAWKALWKTEEAPTEVAEVAEETPAEAA